MRSLARLIQLENTGLHFNRGTQSVFVVLGIRLRAAKDSEDSVAEKFVDRSIVGKNHGNKNLQILIQHLEHIVWLHVLRHPSEAPNIRIEDRDLTAAAAQTQSPAVRQQLSRHLRGKLSQEVGHHS